MCLNWISFNLLILIFLTLDLCWKREEKVKYALYSSCFWIALAFVFNIFVYFCLGKIAAIQFLSGFLLEKILSLDNLIVFMMIFTYLNIPYEDQRKILFWGVVGAIVSRGLFILIGVQLISSFHWMLKFFGLFLIYAGYRLSVQSKSNPLENPIVKFLKNKFALSTFGIALVAIETTDILFALDSIPAIFAITQDPYIIYTSNIFAILGLRSLFFALSPILKYFKYLHVILAALLVLIGIKMIFS